MHCTYVLPMRSAHSEARGELNDYIRWLAPRVELIIVDGSAPDVYAEHADAWGELARHVPPALVTPMGKVGGVLTGVQLASHERIVIADDDVRYDERSLAQVISALDDADVVRPQNYFDELPWHARWDSSRSLLNRLHGGDWPGTLGLRRSVLIRTDGYDGSAMFENLELVRTVIASGGRETVLLDAFVARRPSTTRHFFSQRIRQAYDELARPARLAWQLALLPASVLAVVRYGWPALAIAALVAIGLAELGRRRAGATRVFPASTPLFAPLWLAERAMCSWLAVASRVTIGGVRYRGRVLRHAATPMRVLRERHGPTAPSAAPRRRATPARSA